MCFLWTEAGGVQDGCMGIVARRAATHCRSTVQFLVIHTFSIWLYLLAHFPTERLAASEVKPDLVRPPASVGGWCEIGPSFHRQSGRAQIVDTLQRYYYYLPLMSDGPERPAVEDMRRTLVDLWKRLDPEA